MKHFLNMAPDGRAGAYSDRVRPPAETVAALRPHFAGLGITRLARQTGLDRVGIPCFAAIRPNSRTLASHQGKGLTDDAAMASAVMEAAEYAVAERPSTPRALASAGALGGAGIAVFDPSRQLPLGGSIDLQQSLDWLTGHDLLTGTPVAVPEAVVRFDDRPPLIAGLSRSTNGLASGNCREEAIFHGLCELVERDSITLWTLRLPEQQQALAVAPRAFDDAAVDDLAARIHAAGLTLMLFDLTSDTGVPTIMAMIGGGQSDEDRYFGITSGYGTHPVACRAAVRAITEAAQSRVTIIAGSRDDFCAGDFRRASDPEHEALLKSSSRRSAPTGLPLGAGLTELLDSVLGALHRVEADAVAVEVGGAEYGIAVVKVLSRVLEDRESNCNWRPGGRSIAALMRLQ